MQKRLKLSLPSGDQAEGAASRGYRLGAHRRRVARWQSRSVSFHRFDGSFDWDRCYGSSARDLAPVPTGAWSAGRPISDFGYASLLDDV
jgi:hypothetical protein